MDVSRGWSLYRKELLPTGLPQSRAPTAYLYICKVKAVVLTSFKLFGLTNFVRPNTWKTKILYLSIDRIWIYL